MPAQTRGKLVLAALFTILCLAAMEPGGAGDKQAPPPAPPGQTPEWSGPEGPHHWRPDYPGIIPPGLPLGKGAAEQPVNPGPAHALKKEGEEHPGAEKAQGCDPGSAPADGRNKNISGLDAPVLPGPEDNLEYAIPGDMDFMERAMPAPPGEGEVYRFLAETDTGSSFSAGERFGSGSELHFLLIGRRPEDKLPDVLMVVTLVPETLTRLLSLDPAATAGHAGQDVAALLASPKAKDHREAYRSLVEAAGEITGRTISFYIELNLDGFVEMVDLLGGCPELPEASPERGNLLEGETLLYNLTNSPDHGLAEKQDLITALLETARDAEGTALGLKLLWTGYRNLRTDITLQDLLRVRAITQQIQPDRVYLRELTDY